jgi:hypothetical protein
MKKILIKIKIKIKMKMIMKMKIIVILNNKITLNILTNFKKLVILIKTSTNKMDSEKSLNLILIMNKFSINKFLFQAL